MIQLNESEMQLVTLISKECTSPADVPAKLKNLFAGTLEKMLEAVMVMEKRLSRANGVKAR